MNRISNALKGMKRVFLNALGSKRGTTIVSIMVAFAMLMLITAGFYTSIRIAQNISNRALDTRKSIEAGMQDYYTETSGRVTVDKTLRAGTNAFEIPVKIGTFKSDGINLTYFEAAESGGGGGG